MVPEPLLLEGMLSYSKGAKAVFYHVSATAVGIFALSLGIGSNTIKKKSNNTV